MASIKNENKNEFTLYKKTNKNSKNLDEQFKNANKKNNCKKIRKTYSYKHKKTMKEFPIIEQMINSNPKIAKELGLDEDELVYLRR